MTVRVIEITPHPETLRRLRVRFPPRICATRRADRSGIQKPKI